MADSGYLVVFVWRSFSVV